MFLGDFLTIHIVSVPYHHFLMGARESAIDANDEDDDGTGEERPGQY